MCLHGHYCPVHQGNLICLPFISRLLWFRERSAGGFQLIACTFPYSSIKARPPFPLTIYSTAATREEDQTGDKTQARKNRKGYSCIIRGMWLLNENRKTVWHLKAMTVSILCQRWFVIQPGTTSDRAHLRICLPYAYQKSGMCARFLPWHTGSIAIKGRNSSTLASSDILKHRRFTPGVGGGRVCLPERVFVCTWGMRMREGVPDIRSQKKWGWSIYNFFPRAIFNSLRESRGMSIWDQTFNGRDCPIN